jgi:hypothetical protein
VALLAAFTAWELRRDDPMIPLQVFRNGRFSAASVSVALVFFSLFGALFLLTQILQFVLGYSSLRAGASALPFAFRSGSRRRSRRSSPRSAAARRSRSRPASR